MKIARFRADRRVVHGVLEGDEFIEIRGSIYTQFRFTSTRYKLAEIKPLPPTTPSQIWLSWCCSGKGLPGHPEPTYKGLNALTGYDDPIIIPKDSSGGAHCAGEIVAVIGKYCRRVSIARASRYILGYTMGNDIVEPTWQVEDQSAWRARGSDTFAPVGPWIETEVDDQDLESCMRINGQEVQRTSPRERLFSFREVVSYISQQVALQPGDLVFSGHVASPSPLKAGDTVEVDVPGIGSLRNPVVAEYDSPP